MRTVKKIASTFALASLLYGYAAYGAVEIVAPGYYAGDYATARLTPTLEWSDGTPKTFGTRYKVIIEELSWGASPVAIWTQIVTATSGKTDYSTKYAGPTLAWDSWYGFTVERKDLVGRTYETTASDWDYFVTTEIIIAEIDGKGEDVVIENLSSWDVDMSYWELRDSPFSYDFPSFILESGKSVTIHTESGTDSDTDLYIGYDRAIWNNEGDSGSLYDARGDLIDTYTY